MGTGKWLLLAAAATTGIVTFRVGCKVLKVFMIREQQYHWLGSIVPPVDYQYLSDVASAESITKRYPQLQNAVDSGTLCVLTRPDDFDRALPEELFILGTAHVSRRTAEDVYDTIVATEPDAVVVELCRSRAFIMYRKLDEDTDDKPPARGPNTSTSMPAKTSAVASEQGVSKQETDPTQSNTHSRTPAAAGAVEAPGEDAARSKAASGPPMSELLAAGLKGLRQGQGLLQTLLGVAYLQFEGQLKTVAGLEFVRARQAVEEVERKRKRAHLRSPEPTAVSAVAARAVEGAIQTSGSFDSSAQGQLPAMSRQASSVVEVVVEDAPDDAEEVNPEAEANRHTHVYWGDVPIARTVGRAWGVLSLRQKVRLVWELVWDILFSEVDEKMLEELLKQDIVQLLQRELGSKYPEIMGPLLHERNWQLAYTVHQAAQHGMRKVALVVGKGHVPGIIYCLLHPYRMRKANRAYRAQSASNMVALSAQQPSF